MKNFFLIAFFIGILSTNLAYARHKKDQTPTVKILSVAEIKALEKRAMEEINQIRVEQGLNPLKHWEELSDCARGHSEDMASEKVPFGHQGFEDRAEKMMDLGKLCSFGENVAYNFNYPDPVRNAVKGWMNSPPHKKNILGDFEETGFGIAINKEGRYYYTQLFAKRKIKSMTKRFHIH
jgi:uncharacterized protein YkwD